MAAKQGFLKYLSTILNCDVVETKVNVCRSSEVVAKRGSTVMLEYKGENPNCNYFWIIVILYIHTSRICEIQLRIGA